jgi:hypothetical protein
MRKAKKLTYLLKSMALSWMASTAILRNAAETSGGTGDATPPADPATILFPDEGKKDETPAAGDIKADDKANADADAKTDDKAGEWKEYVPDSTKTDAENAALKAEHDKGNPALPANQVPEDGKYTLTMPEGVELDAGLLEGMSPRFKELGLTQGQAQALADDFIKAGQAKAVKDGEAWATRIAGWANDAKADKDIGGAKWDATVRDAHRATLQLGTPELKEYLNASGGGNHPEMIRFFAKVGGLIKEDSPPTNGGTGNGKPAETAHLLFPNDAPKG